MTTARQRQLLDQARRVYDAGDLEGARALCEQLLALGRRHPEGLHLLGLALNAQGRYDEAARVLDRCAALRPREIAVQLALGRAQMNRGRYGPALDRFARALKIDPASREAVEGRAEVFYARGDHRRVLALLEPIAGRGEATVKMGLTLARSQSASRQTEAALETIARFVAAPEASLEMRRQLLFLRGRIQEREGACAEAFATYEEANRVEPGRYDPAAYRRRVDDLVAVYSRANLARAPRAGHGLEAPVLIVGMPRTGSTLLERMIDAHPLARGVSEISALQEIVGSLSLTIESTAPYPRCVLEMDEAGADRAGRAYVDALRAAGGAAPKRLVDKNLYNYESVGLVALIVPGARVIDCRRDAMDTCLACFAEPLAPDGHAYASSLEHLAERYLQYRRLMDHWREVLDRPPLEVFYEQLTADPEAAARTIIDHVGLPWDDRCLKFQESRFTTRTLSVEQVRKPVYRTSVGRARRFAAHLAPLRRRLEPPEADRPPVPAAGGPKTDPPRANPPGA